MCNLHNYESIFDYIADGYRADEGDLMLCVNCAKVFANTHKPQYFEGNTCLHVICDEIIVDNIDAILEIFSKDINTKNDLGETPFHILAYMCNSVPNGGISNFRFHMKKSFISFFIKKRANVWINDNEGITPYDIFMKSKDETIKKMIIDYSKI